MNKNETLHTDLLPGRVRLVVQIYDNKTGKRMYRQPPGLSVSGIDVRNSRELKRLCNGLRDLVDGAQWRDINQNNSTSAEQTTT